MEKILQSLTSLGLWLIGLAIIFSLLAMISPCNRKQKIFRGDIFTDILYSAIFPLISMLGVTLFITAGIAVIFYGESQETALQYINNGYGVISTLPMWLQIALYMIISDFLLYWIHRGFHTSKLWKYHAIHHSPEELDWLAAYRFHPVNVWLYNSLVHSLMLLSGFAPAVAASLSAFNIIYSAMVHANLNWTFGPFRYLFASPVFHRWHHTSQDEGMDKNFAPTFPIFDVMFGTFYMPQRLPERYGVHGSDIPKGFFGQIIWPFKNRG